MFDPVEALRNAIKKANTIQPNSALSCLVAEVVAVDDPLNLGRCKVKLQNFTAENNSMAYSTDWCNTITTKVTKGRLPSSLVGTIVLAFPVHQSYETVVVNLNNSLIYNSKDKIPEPCVENLGVQIVIVSAQEAFKSVCLLRNGVYAWVSVCDLKHGHSSGDTQDQDNDTGGDFQVAIEQGIIHDTVFSTATTPYTKESGFTPPVIT
jgi:hypothetical protein